ncbi:hypothetical protein B0H19DRAFT_1323333 [Mycena capillaripes]|nr:hypothetical protein B0H19DRAFT_1323333 [Mycena capillaripes]
MAVYPSSTGIGVDSRASIVSKKLQRRDIECPPTDDSGSSLTETLLDSDGSLACTYVTAGKCVYVSDRAFSGSPICPGSAIPANAPTSDSDSTLNTHSGGFPITITITTTTTTTYSQPTITLQARASASNVSISTNSDGDVATLGGTDPRSTITQTKSFVAAAAPTTPIPSDSGKSTRKSVHRKRQDIENQALTPGAKSNAFDFECGGRIWCHGTKGTQRKDKGRTKMECVRRIQFRMRWVFAPGVRLKATPLNLNRTMNLKRKVSTSTPRSVETGARQEYLNRQMRAVLQQLHVLQGTVGEGNAGLTRQNEELRARIQILEEQLQSQWALGLSDEPPPGYLE